MGGRVEQLPCCYCYRTCFCVQWELRRVKRDAHTQIHISAHCMLGYSALRHRDHLRLAKTQEINTEFYLENTNPTVPTADNGTDAASPYVTADSTHAHSCVTLVTLEEATPKCIQLASSAYCSWWAWPRRHVGLIPRNPFCCSATY